MAKERILVVEDEEPILELIAYNLTRDGYRASGVASGEEAVERAKADPPSLVILDLMLPGMDGLEVCRLLKASPRTAHVPIVMLTAKGEEADIVSGLELGADDYVTKPFSPKVLTSRIRAVLRRGGRERPEESSALQIHDLVIHPGRHEVSVEGAAVELTTTEFRILHFLARRPGWVFTRSQILKAIHSDDFAVTDRSVDVQIVNLRKKLGSAGEYVETVRGVGYRFKE